MFQRKLMPLMVAGALLSMASVAQAGNTHFDNFNPLSASSPALPTGSPLEATPLTLSSSNFSQRSIADRNTQLAAGQVNSGSWDMITTNETGADKGRYLFTVFETSSAGVQRTDLLNGTTSTIWQSPGVAPALNSHVAFDASYWTPWGTYITAEENWGAQPNPYGRLFELKNPLTATSNANANFVHQNVIPRTSHEGIQFDRSANMYFIDELNGGTVFKYESTAGAGANYFDAGTTSVLRVGDGNTANATGAFSWVPFTDANGAALAGAVTIVDPNGISSVDGRASANVAAYKGTDYQRPEDLQTQISATGDELLYMTTTTTNEIYVINLTDGDISVFANRDTIDLATGLAVGNALTSPDNLARDAEGNIYIIEDQPGGVADIWFAKDINKDGDLKDAGEGLARWLSMNTNGAEPTGLYFDPFNANRAWVNIQHPNSGNDRLIEITAVPEPETYALMLGGLGLAGLIARRRTARK